MSDLEKLSLDALWPPSSEPPRFDPAQIAHHPEPVRRYLGHAIAPGTPLSRAVRLEQAGEIRLGEQWRSFTATQVIAWPRGFIWQARVRMGPLTVRGSDRLVDGEAAMRWKLLGLLPVMKAAGPEIARSAIGRMQGEVVWLPAVLLDAGTTWEVLDEARVAVSFAAQGHAARLELSIDAEGRPRSVAFPRWGDPEGGAFAEHRFGARFEDEATFGGFTVPSRLRVGWHPGEGGFEPGGEFWRATLSSGRFR